MKVQYQDINMSAKSLAVVEQANTIINAYERQGFTLTLRQLYYQFVSRDLIPNSQREYKRLGDIVSKGRLAGLIDWNAIEDRGRFQRSNQHWDSIRDIIEAAKNGYRIDLWHNQPKRVVVRIEKDALVGVIARVCEDNDIPYTACRGYSSQSEQWRSGRLLRNYIRAGQEPVVLYLGDHDPSGIDMTRDNEERLSLFAGKKVEVRRIALNMPQVEQYNPPPNPAKDTDSRHSGYTDIYGESCWELDALEPSVIAQLIQEQVDDIRDPDLWREALNEQQAGLDRLDEILGDLE